LVVKDRIFAWIYIVVTSSTQKMNIFKPGEIFKFLQKKQEKSKFLQTGYFI